MFNADQELAKLSRAQRQMLSQVAPQIPGYDLKLAYLPAYIATGDYHDFFPSPNGVAAAFVGDGSGHGPYASVLVATMRAIFRTHPEVHGDPGRALTAAGRMLYTLLPADSFMTGLYVRFADAGRVSWASAGHDPPLRVSRLGHLTRTDLKPVGLPLGVDEHEVYHTVHWDLCPCERLVLFTDGLVEAQSRLGEPFGRRRLRSSVGELAHLPVDDMVRELIARVAAHRARADFEDDFSLLGVAWQGAD
jgi:sigma-B regulation protein RsbU (phosphoserine phosphatase)